jgi:hypothetical protein
MKKTILTLVLIICAVFCVHSSPADLILLLDSSSGMSSSYDNVNDYLTGAFLSENLSIGDTFHLIAFSATPRLDVARRIAGIGDVETIIARIFLQFPVESGSNIREALTFTEQYITTLPARPKKIFLVSDGGSDTNSLVSSARTRLAGRNTTIDFIQVTNLPVSAQQATQRQIPAGTINGRTVTNESQTLNDRTVTNESLTLNDRTVTNESQTFNDRTAINDLSTTNEPSTVIPVTGTVAGSADSQDTDSSLSVGTNRDSAARERFINQPFSSIPFIIGIILLALLLLGLIVFFASRKLGSSPDRVVAKVASSSPASAPKEKFIDHSKDLAKYASAQNRRTTPYDNRSASIEDKPVVINASGPLILNIFVEEQNTAIGKRNIHSLKSGYKLTVGGSKSDDFFMFLVPLPPHIGDIRRNGSQLTFIPRKAKYFPDIGSSEVKDCLNKTIRVISDKNYEVRFRFEMYEDPLESLNRVLMSVKVPG